MQSFTQEQNLFKFKSVWCLKNKSGLLPIANAIKYIESPVYDDGQIKFKAAFVYVAEGNLYRFHFNIACEKKIYFQLYMDFKDDAGNVCTIVDNKDFYLLPEVSDDSTKWYLRYIEIGEKFFPPLEKDDSSITFATAVTYFPIDSPLYVFSEACPLQRDASAKVMSAVPPALSEESQSDCITKISALERSVAALRANAEEWKNDFKKKTEAFDHTLVRLEKMEGTFKEMMQLKDELYALKEAFEESRSCVSSFSCISDIPSDGDEEKFGNKKK